MSIKKRGNITVGVMCLCLSLSTLSILVLNIAVNNLELSNTNVFNNDLYEIENIEEEYLIYYMKEISEYGKENGFHFEENFYVENKGSKLLYTNDDKFLLQITRDNKVKNRTIDYKICDSNIVLIPTMYYIEE